MINTIFHYCKKTNFFNILFLIFNVLVIIPQSYSMKNTFTINKKNLNLYKLANNESSINNDFTENPTLFISYGPLFIDMNNIKYKDSVFFLPTLNDQSKPIFLAVYCDSSLINVKGSEGWKGWHKSFYSFEYKLLNKLCDSVDKY